VPGTGGAGGPNGCIDDSEPATKGLTEVRATLDAVWAAFGGADAGFGGVGFGGVGAGFGGVGVGFGGVGGGVGGVGGGGGFVGLKRPRQTEGAFACRRR
jgi:hypothetical protein